VPNVNIRTALIAAILSAAMGRSAPIPEPLKPLAAFHDGAEIVFAPESGETTRLATFGPWTLGQPLREEKPLDKRLNLYILIPGRQYRSPTRPEYDHTLLVNTLTEDRAREWDIYWCFVLDSSVAPDIRSEHDLLVAAQESFRPRDLFDVEDIPGHEVMAEKLNVKDLSDLRKYRHKDRTLPRVLIVPARVALRATAANPAEKPAQ
jgi:hypothetical protein